MEAEETGKQVVEGSKEKDKKKKSQGKKESRPEKAPAYKLAQYLMDGEITLSTAESCTGGLVAAKLTSVPGVSAVYRGGYVTYATDEKKKMLGVSKKVLKEAGAVSKKAAKQMAKGAAEKTGSDTAVSVTGNAGPDPMEDKPVGLVYVGYVIDGEAGAKEFHFEGDRNEIREQAADAALKLLYKKLKKKDEEPEYEKISDDKKPEKSGKKDAAGKDKKKAAATAAAPADKKVKKDKEEKKDKKAGAKKAKAATAVSSEKKTKKDDGKAKKEQKKDRK